jgi:hypothetical protein
MDLEHTIGLRPDGSILLKLAVIGVEIPTEAAGDEDRPAPCVSSQLGT